VVGASIFGAAVSAVSSIPFGFEAPKLGHLGAVMERTPLRHPPPARLARRMPIATAPSLPRRIEAPPGAEAAIPWTPWIPGCGRSTACGIGMTKDLPACVSRRRGARRGDKGSAAGELAARFDVVLGYTPKE
jgi:hypothetical protein